MVAIDVGQAITAIFDRRTARTRSNLIERRGNVVAKILERLDSEGIAHQRFRNAQLRTFRSVSYTHLDVYKRQLYACH